MPSSSRKRSVHEAISTPAPSDTRVASEADDPTALNRVPACDVYALLGFRSVQAMNHTRRVLQRVVDPITGGINAYPDFGAIHPSETPAEIRSREVAFERTATLVVPQWGGIKYPLSAWQYDLARCRAVNRDGIAVLTTYTR